MGIVSDLIIQGEFMGQQAAVEDCLVPRRIRYSHTDPRGTAETRSLFCEDPTLYEGIGIKVEPIAGDAIMQKATLPDGWKMKASPEHAMWNRIYDEKGKERVLIFYKASYYDRKAHAWITEPATSRLLNRLKADGCTSAHWSTVAGMDVDNLQKALAGTPVHTPFPRYENGQLIDMTEEIAEEALRILDSPTCPDTEVLGDRSL